MVRPLATWASCTVVRTRSPDLWTVPLRIASTPNVRPAASGYLAGPLYLATAQVGNTTSCLKVLSLPITASAMPSPNNSSCLSLPSGSNGRTAIEWTMDASAAFAREGLVSVSRSEPRLWFRSSAANLLSERRGSNRGSYLIIRASPVMRTAGPPCNSFSNHSNAASF